MMDDTNTTNNDDEFEVTAEVFSNSNLENDNTNTLFNEDIMELPIDDENPTGSLSTSNMQPTPAVQPNNIVGVISSNKKKIFISVGAAIPVVSLAIVGTAISNKNKQTAVDSILSSSNTCYRDIGGLHV